MKRTLIITLLLLVAAFSFGQTNSTFNNLDVRNTTKLRGLIYPFGAVATSPINTAVHEIAMINNTTFALCRMDFKEFADSIANYLNPIIGTHWARIGNYLYPITLSDSVGIGTDTPIEQLSVQGNASISDTAYIGSGWVIMNDDRNTFVGVEAGISNASGTANTFIGFGAGSSNDGDANVFIGNSSGTNNTSGEHNVFISAGNANTEGSKNVFIGNASAASNTTGEENSYIGYHSGYTATDGDGNSTLGFETLNQNVTGSYNVAIGYMAGRDRPSGDYNVLLGPYAGQTDGGSNKLYIENSNADSTGALIFGNFATDRLTFNADIVYGDTHWDDLTTSAAQAKIGANNKPVYDYDSLALRWEANDTTTNYTAHNFQLRHTYAQGTSIYPHVHYWQKTAADTCEWMILLYRWTDIGETRPAYTRIHTNNQTVEPYTSGTLHQIAAFPAIVDGSAHTESSIFDCKLYVYSNGILYTSQLDIHFEQNKPGTYNEYP